MSQVVTGVRSALSLPAVYRAFINLAGGDRAYREFVGRYARPRPGDHVVDIGCGTGHLVLFLPGVDYVGYDADPDYIDAARRRYGRKGSFFLAGVGSPPPLPDHGFDLAIAFGVIHHLGDAAAGALFRDARALLMPGGRLVTCDGSYAEDQSRVARWLIAHDRGQAIRTQGTLEALARTHFTDVRSDVRHDLLRIPYTHVILECRG